MRGPGTQSVGAGEQIADDAFDARPGKLGLRRVGAEAGQHAGRVGPVRCPLAVEVRDEHQPTCAGGRIECQRVELGVVDGEESGHGVGDLGRVHGTDQWEEAARGIGEPGHRAGRITRSGVRDRERGATRPEAEGEIARAQTQAQRRGHVVARPGGHRDPGAAPLAGDGVRGEHVGQHRVPVDVLAHEPEKFVAVAAFTGRPVPRTRGITPIGGPPTREPEGEPVVREEDGRDALERLGFVPPQPMQFGDGEAGDGDTAARVSPGGPAPGQGAQQHARVGGRLRVVPELGRAQSLAVLTHNDETMLLRRHRNGAWCLVVRSGGFGVGHMEGVLPFRRALFAARRGRGWVRRSTRGHDGAGLGIAHLHLAC